MRIISFSADGVREAAGRGFFEWVSRQDADFICIQDLRCSEYDLQDELFFPSEYNAYFFDDINGKDNGVALYCRELPKAIMTGLGFADFDMQGRYIQADFASLSIGCLLAPHAADDDDDAQEAKDEFYSLLGGHLQKVRNKRRDFIICGNWGIAPEAIDLENSEAAQGRSGFLLQEQGWMDELFQNGYADAYREVSSDSDAFSFWPDSDADSEAHSGYGWRVDLQVVSEELRQTVEHAAFFTGQAFSRHAPLIVDYDIEL